MTNWKTVRLGDVISKSDIMRNESQDYPILSMTMHEGLIFQKDRFSKQIASIDRSNYLVVKRNQLVQSFPIDEGVLDINRISDFGIVSPAYKIWNVNEREIYGEYLVKVLRCEKSLSFYKQKLKGTTARRRTISDVDFLGMQIPLPPLATQKHIAAVLDKCTEVITKHKLMLEKYDTLIKSQFVEMFGDIIQNTKNWELRNFTEIAKSRLGKMLDSKKQTGKEKYPYLANFNVQWFRFNLESLNEMDFSEADRIEFALKDGDLLVCEGGEVGRCAVWHNQIENCFFQKAIHRVRLNIDIVQPDYMAFWFKSRSDYNSFADILGSQSTIAHLTGAKLKLLKIPVPPLALQEKFAAFVQAVDAQKAKAQKSLEKAEILYKALMQEYFG